MSEQAVGDKINRALMFAQTSMFRIAEQSQLTFLAYELAAQEINAPDGPETKTISYPIGLRADRTAIPSERTYTRDDLLQQYRLLAVHQLSVNGLSQLVSVVEAMLEDTLRIVLRKFPKKLGAQKQIDLQLVLEASSIEEVHSKAIDALLNESSYKSPRDFAKSFESFTGVNLLESPAFHRYIEVKATRDVFIHNRGVANQVYLRKSGSHARATMGSKVPCEIGYFLESYEACLQLTEWLESGLNGVWPSSDFETRRTSQMEMPLDATEDNSPEHLSTATSTPRARKTKKSSPAPRARKTKNLRAG
jgi:hypothetical protein